MIETKALTPSRPDIERFVSHIFRYADEGTFISLRAFDQKDRGRPPVLIEAVEIAGTLARVVAQATFAAERSANTDAPSVFAPPVATFHDKNRARSEDVANGVALSVEMDAGDPAAALRRLESIIGPATVIVHSGGEWADPETGEVHPKTHLHWRLSEPTREPVGHQRLQYARTMAAKLVGGDPTACPPAHPLRWPGSWNTKAKPRLAKIAGGNEAAEVHLDLAIERLEEAIEAAGGGVDNAPRLSGAPTADMAHVAAAMAAIPNLDAHWDDWVRLGMAAYAASGGSQDGLDAWCEWSAKSTKHEDQACVARWKHFAASPPARIGAGTIFFMARAEGWTRPEREQEPPASYEDPGSWAGIEAEREEKIEPEKRSTAPDLEAKSDDGDIPPFCTDDALALMFSEKYAGQLRHVAVWSKWMEWTGTHWCHDPTLATYDRARKVCRKASVQCNNARVAAKVASASTVAAVERLAKADRRHAATVEQWDADPWLLNTPGGTVDLRTGKMRRHAASDHLTKLTAVAPGGECPLWLAFLDRATGSDTALQGFLQRMAGYCLTGSIKEHALFFAYGTGANGKGVTINTLTAIMGDYATVASIETFTASPSDRHPTDLAMLRGARLVTAQETEEGRRWAESRIKAMTGGDPITARFMRQDFFTYVPTFKLLIAGNHRPGLRNVDEAIRRRFNLIPFDVKIPPSERDLDLPEKLKVEWPGILKWAISGCLEWQRVGLASPPAVIDATAEYLEAEDAISTWTSECCTKAATFMTASASLYASWKTWADGAGEHAGSQKAFAQSLASRGYQPARIGHSQSRGFRGIGLKPDSHDGRYGS